MKKANVFSAVAVTTGILLGTVGVQAQYQQGPPPPPPGAYGQGPGGQGPGGWEGPPPEFRDEIHQRGFRDGIEGARKDFGNHRPPNVNNRDEFRHPPVPRGARHDYRDGFRRGYQVGVQHIYGGGPGGPGPR